MKAPLFSAYAPTPAAVAATLDQLASPAPPAGPPPASCPRCGGSGTNHHEIWNPADFGRAHECRTCHGTGQQQP